jgi:hypothetical protein
MGRSIIHEPAMIGTWRERAEKTRAFLAAMGTPGKLIGGRTRAKYPKFGRVSSGWEHHADGIDYVLSQLPADKADELNTLLFPRLNEKREGSEGSPFRTPVFTKAAQEVLNDVAAASPLMPEVHHKPIPEYGHERHVEPDVELPVNRAEWKGFRFDRKTAVFGNPEAVTWKSKMVWRWNPEPRRYQIIAVSGDRITAEAVNGVAEQITFHYLQFKAVAK